jgi:hypothetical protein
MNIQRLNGEALISIGVLGMGCPYGGEAANRDLCCDLRIHGI